MKKIRLGKDIIMTWQILTNDLPEDLEGRDLTLILTDPANGRQELPITVTGNTVEAVYHGTEQKYTGGYSITLIENRGKKGQSIVDQYNAFYLVPWSEQEEDGEGLGSSLVQLSTAQKLDLSYETVREINDINLNNI